MQLGLANRPSHYVVLINLPKMLYADGSSLPLIQEPTYLTLESTTASLPSTADFLDDMGFCNILILKMRKTVS